MRGNKKLIQRISKVGATGILACAVSFSLPQIMQTEDLSQMNTYGISGSVFELGEGDLFSKMLSKAVTFGRDGMITVEAAARDNSKLYSDGKIVKIQGSTQADDESADEDLATIADDEEKDSQEDVKAKANNIKEKSRTAAADEASESKSENQDAVQKKAAGTKASAKAATKQVSNEAETKTSKKVNEKTKAATEKENQKVETNKTSVKEAKAAANKKTSAKAENSAKAKSASKTEAKTAKQDSVSKKWKNKLMADVDDRLNIRKASSEDSEIVGRLRKGDVAKVLKKGKEWTKITSGSVTGYVKNEYCVYGAKAYKLAKKVCNTYATVNTDGLRIRKKPSEKATILDAAYKGDQLPVHTKKQEKDGWVVVRIDDMDGYVSEEYVNVALGTGVALSMEEEMKQIAAEEQARKEAEQAAAQSAAANTVSASSSSAVSTNSSLQAASSDLTLLSAIIFCEAGGESYAGQVAVGAVVMNRVNSGSFPNSISGVVYESGQFSPVANGSLSRALSNGSYQHCMSAAREALAGNDNTGGAKFFHRVNGDAGLVIGNHVFY